MTLWLSIGTCCILAQDTGTVHQLPLRSVTLLKDLRILCILGNPD